MRRRTLLQTGSLSLISLQLGLLTGCDRQGSSSVPALVTDDEAIHTLREMARGLKGIDFVGPSCRAAFDQENLAQAILDRLADKGPVTLQQALSEQIAFEFASQDRFDIHGWQLAHTECMLLGLAAQEQGLVEPRRQDQQPLNFQDFADIDSWGPQETIQHEIFNPLANGRGAFWVRVNRPVPGSTRLVLDGVELATHFGSGVVTASLEPEYMDTVIANPGLYELMMVDTARNLAQRIGHLTVRQKSPKAMLDNGRQSEVFCEVERWGPDRAVQGQAFNEQPNGEAAFWVRIGCAATNTELVLDGQSLPTTVSSGIVTARVPHYASLSAGEHILRLHDPDSGEILTVGTLTIL